MKTYTPEEIASNRETWLTALRSGHYEQGQGFLRQSPSRYCCLGVYMDINGGGEWCVVDTPYDDIPKQYQYTSPIGNSAGELPLDARASLGLSTLEHGWIVLLNDTEGYTFEQIADTLEKRWSHPSPPLLVLGRKNGHTHIYEEEA